MRRALALSALLLGLRLLAAEVIPPPPAKYFNDYAQVVSAETAAQLNQTLENFEREGHPYYATARLWDDGIIAPGETRRVVALALSAALNAPIPDMRFGVFRM